MPYLRIDYISKKLKYQYKGLTTVLIAFITKYSNNLIMNVCTDLSLEEFNNLINKLKAYADRYIYKETTKNLNKFEEDNNFRKEAVNFIKKKLGL
jgi:hypothetical protein